MEEPASEAWKDWRKDWPLFPTFKINTDGAIRHRGWIDQALKGADKAAECWYVAGPMRGYNLWNFPAFDRRRDELVAAGFRVISPVDLDRVRGFTEHMTDFPPDSFHDMMAVDITAIMDYCVGIDLLPGWSQSTGARYEWVVAEALGKRIQYGPGAENCVLAITPVES